MAEASASLSIRRLHLKLNRLPSRTALLRNQLYFRLKPVIPAPLRRAIRQWVAVRIRQRTQDNWPILPGSEQPPESWPGWPHGRRFALVLTHDVERQEGLANCRPLMELEAELGFRSTFNFVPEGSYQPPATLRENLVAKGFGVGVHDLRHDGHLFHSRKSFSKKAVQINQYLHAWNARGFRSGFMLHNLNWLHELDIDYDMSTFDTDPFEPQPDGCHTIFPFWVQRPTSAGRPSSGNNGSAFGYVELPYTLPQDSTLFLLLGEQTPQIWLRKVDWIARHGGMVLVNIHPDYIDFDGAGENGTKYPAALVRQFLTYLSANYSGQFWNPSAAELAAWYKDWHRSVQAKKATLSHPFCASPASPPRLQGKRAAVVLFSHYPADPRPRRAAEALAAEGVEIELICLQGASEPRRETIHGVNVTRIPLKRRRRGKMRYVWQYSAFTAISFWVLAIRSLRRHYDFVHVHNMPDILVFSAAIPKLLGAKIVLDLHDPMPELMQAIFRLTPDSAPVRLLERLEKWSMGFADSVVTVSRTFKDLFSARSCPSEKICVVLNSPDERIFKLQRPRVQRRRAGDLTTPYVILYHGSLLRRNGFDLAVDALELTLKSIPCVKLLVCGASTPFFETVMSSLRARGLSHKVEYLGACDLGGIVRAIESCDMGIIPNHRNIFTELNTPTRIFECLALGKPVIAPRARGILDYFGDQDLIYFELGDAGDLAAKIRFAFENPDEVERILERGQQVYIKHTWNRERENLINSFLSYSKAAGLSSVARNFA